MPLTTPELGPENKQRLVKVRQMFSELRSFPPEYDFQMPVMISHASEEAAESEERLRRYAGQTVGARIMQFGYLNIYKAVYLTESVFAGKTGRNPYQIASAARSLMEIAAVVTNVWDIINTNRGDQNERLAERVQIIDDTLIQATYGHRSEVLKEFLGKTTLSELRPVEPRDEKVFTAKNVLTRLTKWQDSGTYPECEQDYNTLCEVLHPNAWQNTILMNTSPYGAKFARISRRSLESPMWLLGRACRPVEMSLKVILTSIKETNPPFKSEMSPPLPGMAQSPFRIN